MSASLKLRISSKKNEEGKFPLFSPVKYNKWEEELMEDVTTEDRDDEYSREVSKDHQNQLEEEVLESTLSEEDTSLKLLKKVESLKEYEPLLTEENDFKETLQQMDETVASLSSWKTDRCEKMKQLNQEFESKEALFAQLQVERMENQYHETDDTILNYDATETSLLAHLNRLKEQSELSSKLTATIDTSMRHHRLSDNQQEQITNAIQHEEDAHKSIVEVKEQLKNAKLEWEITNLSHDLEAEKQIQIVQEDLNNDVSSQLHSYTQDLDDILNQFSQTEENGVPSISIEEYYCTPSSN